MECEIGRRVRESARAPYIGQVREQRHTAACVQFPDGFVRKKIWDF